jgi:hypothetical protein
MPTVESSASRATSRALLDRYDRYAKVFALPLFLRRQSMTDCRAKLLTETGYEMSQVWQTGGLIQAEMSGV